MNGRVYDPEIGVFLSADPLVQFPHSTQGLTRYAYVGSLRGGQTLTMKPTTPMPPSPLPKMC